MDMIACKIAGRNSNTAMETVSFSLVSFDKVRFYIQHTDAYDAGSIDLLKMRIAVFMAVCSASTEQQQWSISRTSDVRARFYCRWDYQFPRSAAWLRIIRRFLLLVGAVLSHRGGCRSWFAKLGFLWVADLIIVMMMFVMTGRYYLFWDSGDQCLCGRS